MAKHGWFLVVALAAAGCSGGPATDAGPTPESYCKVYSETRPTFATMRKVTAKQPKAEVEKIVADVKVAMARRQSAAPGEIRPAWDSMMKGLDTRTPDPVAESAIAQYEKDRCGSTDGQISVPAASAPPPVPPTTKVP